MQDCCSIFQVIGGHYPIQIGFFGQFAEQPSGNKIITMVQLECLLNLDYDNYNRLSFLCRSVQIIGNVRFYFF